MIRVLSSVRPSSTDVTAPAPPSISRTSAAEVTHTPSYSRRMRWQPAEAALVTGPGTASDYTPTAEVTELAWKLSHLNRQRAT